MIYLALILSVIVGVVVAYFLKPKPTFIQILLSFSGAYLLAIIATHLLPEVFENQPSNIGVYIVLGLLLQLILDFFSKGADHGHIHIHDAQKFPWTLFISLCLHAFMEGIPLQNAHDSLLGAIVVHKVPIAIILTTFFVRAKYNLQTIIIALTAFAFMSPLGAFFGKNLPFINDYKQVVNAIIVGVFLHISTVILFESSKNHQFNIVKFIAILVGFALGILV